MTDRVLTDEELEAAFCRPRTAMQSLRAVEAAVLARTCRPMPVLGVSEAEARERERAAYADGRMDASENHALGLGGLQNRSASAMADVRYPPLLPKPPREVVGPSGTRYRKVEGRVERYGFVDGWRPLHCDKTVVMEDVPTVAKLMEGK